MLRRPVVPLLLLSLTGACAIPGDAAWSDLHSTLQAGGIQTTGSGNIAADLSGVFSGAPQGNTSLNLTEEKSSSRYLAGRIGFAPVEFVFSDFSHQSKHSNSLPVQGGTTGIETELDLSVQKLLLGFDFVNTPVTRVGILLGVDFLEFNNFEISLVDPPIGYTGPKSHPLATDTTLPIPVLGLRGDVLFPGTGLRAGGEICGFDLNDFDEIEEMEFIDWDLNLSWSQGNWTEWTLGYRSIGFNLDGSIQQQELSTGLEFDISGPYFNFGVVW